MLLSACREVWRRGFVEEEGLLERPIFLARSSRPRGERTDPLRMSTACGSGQASPLGSAGCERGGGGEVDRECFCRRIELDELEGFEGFEGWEGLGSEEG